MEKLPTRPTIVTKVPDTNLSPAEDKAMQDLIDSEVEASSRIIENKMPPAETLAKDTTAIENPVVNEEKKKRLAEIEEMLSILDSAKKQAKSESTIKESILRHFKTAVLGQSNLESFFADDNKERIKVWSYKNPEITKSSLKDVLAEGKKDNYEGVLGVKEGKLIYVTGKKAPLVANETEI